MGTWPKNGHLGLYGRTALEWPTAPTWSPPPRHGPRATVTRPAAAGRGQRAATGGVVTVESPIVSLARRRGRGGRSRRRPSTPKVAAHHRRPRSIHRLSTEPFRVLRGAYARR